MPPRRNSRSARWFVWSPEKDACRAQELLQRLRKDSETGRRMCNALFCVGHDAFDARGQLLQPCPTAGCEAVMHHTCSLIISIHGVCWRHAKPLKNRGPNRLVVSSNPMSRAPTNRLLLQVSHDGMNYLLTNVPGDGHCFVSRASSFVSCSPERVPSSMR